MLYKAQKMMEKLAEWIPALTTTSLFGGVLWLARSLITTRLTNSVKNEFESKLEVLRSELKYKEAQIESLRSGAMSGLLTRQGTLYTRKLQAIDQIWSSVKELEKAKHISQTLGTLDLEACVRESPKNQNFRKFIEIAGGGFDPTSIDVSGSKLARPYLTPLAWAYFSAYQAVIMQAVVIMQMLKIGVNDAEKLLNLEHTSSLLKKALPLSAEYVDKHGISGHHHLLDQIEQLLLQELKNIQEGKEDDRGNARRAAEITKEIEKISNEFAELQAST